MRLEPVYLVAPRREAKQASRRTLFSVAALSVAVGFLGGFAWRAAPALPPAVEAIVTWAREAGNDASRIDMVRRHYHGFLHALDLAPGDRRLWQAFGRIIDDLERQPSSDPRMSLAVASFRQALRSHGPDLPEAQVWDRRLSLLQGR